MRDIGVKRTDVLAKIIKCEAAGEHLNEEPPSKMVEQRAAALSLLNGHAGEVPKPRRGVSYKALVAARPATRRVEVKHLAGSKLLRHAGPRGV
jgi:hypothetical protein